jgi:hypothetical protein
MFRIREYHNEITEKNKNILNDHISCSVTDNFIRMLILVLAKEKKESV